MDFAKTLCRLFGHKFWVYEYDPAVSNGMVQQEICERCNHRNVTYDMRY